MLVLVCGLLAAGPLFADEIRLPDMGSAAGSVWSPAEAAKIGRELYRSLRRTGKLQGDPLVNEYVASLGARLVAGAGVIDRRFHFFVVDDPSINAFAAPGGYIGVHSGLILAARDEGELAAVLAHEIAHVTQEHLARAYQAADEMSLPTLVALLGAMLVGAQDAELGSAAMAGVAAGSVQRQINFTREHEKEADRIGIQILAAAGFDPNDMPSFFERMQQAAQYAGSQIPTFLRTHPVTGNRIAEARNRAAGMRPQQVALAMDFHLTQARLEALSALDPAEAAARFQRRREETQGMVRAASDYGLALAWLRERRFDEARGLANNLLRRDPDRLAFRMLVAEVESGAGRWEAAIALYAGAQRLFPGSLPLTLQFAETLLKSRRPEEARQLLREQLQPGSGDPALYRLAATAAGDAGQTAEAHAYLAEAFYLEGHHGEALRQIELALKQPNLDTFQESRLAARKRAIEGEMNRERVR
ncbi:MAG: M48 family metallopeptidase [Gammaproteobacteria bacterium]